MESLVALTIEQGKRMNEKLRTGMLPAVCLLVAACSTVPGAQPHRAVRYTCEGGKTIDVTYLRAGASGASFAVLDWNGKEYRLARADSASGARYAGLDGPTAAGHGLQWWEAKSEASLGAFTGKDLVETRPLLTDCRPAS